MIKANIYTTSCEKNEGLYQTLLNHVAVRNSGLNGTSLESRNLSNVETYTEVVTGTIGESEVHLM